MYGGGIAPSGWLLCDGSSYPVLTYPALASVLNGEFGSLGVNFNVPNLSGRVPVGAGTAIGATGATAKTFATLGGEETHTLTIPEMPSHTHNITGGNDIFGNNATLYNQGAGIQLSRISTSGGGLESVFGRSGGPSNGGVVFNSSTGGGLPHNNMQPYIVLNYIIKT